MSAGRFFLDTNVFVYSFDFSAPRKVHIADKLIDEAVRSGRGAVSYQVIQEFFNVAFRKFPEHMTEADAQTYFSNVFRPLYAVSFSPGLLFRAIRISGDYQIAWYDSIIFAAAAETNCEILYSEDFQHGFTVEGVRVQNPFLSN
jgi:predicted nucleic acid-binding protein